MFLFKNFFFSNLSKKIETGIDNIKNITGYPPYLRVGCLKNHIQKISTISA